MTSWNRLLRQLDQLGEENVNAEGSWTSRRVAWGASSSGEFSFTRVGSRWLLQEPVGILRLVGDGDRALRAEAGGLRQLPPTDAWGSEPSGLLLQPVAWGLGSEVLAEHRLVAGPVRDQMSGEDCWSVDLADLSSGAISRLWLTDGGFRLGYQSETWQVLLTSLGRGYPPGFIDEEMLRIPDYIPAA